MSKTTETEQTRQLFAELFDKVVECYTWSINNSDTVSNDDKQLVENFKNEFKNTIYTDLTNNNTNAISTFTDSVDTFMRERTISVNSRGGRRRKSASSSRPRRRSSKKRGTQRKQKRRQRRGSRRA